MGLGGLGFSGGSGNTSNVRIKKEKVSVSLSVRQAFLLFFFFGWGDKGLVCGTGICMGWWGLVLRGESGNVSNECTYVEKREVSFVCLCVRLAFCLSFFFLFFFSFLGGVGAGVLGDVDLLGEGGKRLVCTGRFEVESEAVRLYNVCGKGGGGCGSG